jgi:2-polyprenyl-6-methoxyphenol hydroxylase-like FAD-dependent oxidoreductase
MTTTASHTDVLVVGAGPTGLTCALLLAREGVPVRVIDASPTPITQARAMFLHVRTLELWDRLGIAGTAVERGAPISGVSIWRNGRQAGTLSVRAAFSGTSAFPHSLGLPQDETQRLLLETLAAHPAARVDWGTRLHALRQDDDRVTVDVGTPDGPAVLTADWLVAADGGTSTVRDLLGVAMPGETYDLPEFGADVDLPPGLPTDEMITCSSMGRGLSVMPIGGGRFRVFGTLTPELRDLLGATSDGTDLPLDAVTRWLRDALPAAPTPTAVHRSFAYRIHRRVADRFRVGRVFLAGDAAHMNAPAGGQGINLGMGDGFNLGWKLALVARGLARPALLDTYEGERHPLATTVVRAVDRVYRADQTSGGRAGRATAALANRLTAVAVEVPVVRRRIADAMSQTWISYRRSPAVADLGPRTGVHAGDRLPTADLPQDLREVRWQAVVVDGRDPAAGDALARATAEVLATAALDIPVHRERDAGSVHRALGAAGPLVALVRPDGHLAFRGRTTADLPALRELLDRYLVPSARSRARARPASTVTDGG